jgi:hypothetical protein
VWVNTYRVQGIMQTCEDPRCTYAQGDQAHQGTLLHCPYQPFSLHGLGDPRIEDVLHIYRTTVSIPKGKRDNTLELLLRRDGRPTGSGAHACATLFLSHISRDKPAPT